MELFRLFGSIFIDSKEADESLSKTDKQAEGLGKKLSNAAVTAAKWGAAMGAAAVGVGAAAYKIGAGFDDAFDTIKVGTGASGDALAGLEDDFRAVFRSIPGEMGPAAAAIADLNTMTGESGPLLQNMARSVLEASRILGEDGSSNAKAFGQAIRQWQIPAERAPVLMDALFKTTQDYGIGLNELMTQLNKFGPVMQNAGFSTEETAEFFGLLNKTGIQVTRVMPGLNQAFRKWAAEGKDVRAEMDRVITAVRDAESDTKALTIASEAFGSQGAQRLMTAIRNGAIPSLDELGKSLEGVEGLIEETADATDDFPEKWEKFRNKAMTALEPVASAVFGLAGNVMDDLGPVLENMSQWVTDNMPMIQSVFETTFGTISAVIRFFSDNIIKPLVSVLSGSFGEAGGSVEQFQATVLPIIATVQDVIQKFAELTSAIWNAWGDEIMAAASIAFDTIAAIIGATLKIIEGLLDVFIGLFTGDWERMSNGLKAIWEGLWEGIAAYLSGVWGILGALFGGLFDNIKSWFSDLATAAVEWGANLIRGLWDGVLSMGNWLKDKVTGFISGIFGKAGDDATASSPGNISPSDRRAAGIPQFHNGGRFRAPTPGGEGLALLKDREIVLDERQEKALLGDRITNNFHFGEGSFVISAKDLEEVNTISELLTNLLQTSRAQGGARLV